MLGELRRVRRIDLPIRDISDRLQPRCSVSAIGRDESATNDRLDDRDRRLRVRRSRTGRLAS